MRGAQSISTRRAYGVQRVCRVWHCARSSVYARRQALSSAPGRRRGPIGAAPDDVLVGHIRRVLEASPFHGTNAVGEGLNRIVKIVKNRASGYRHLDSFADMIYLTVGDLDIPAQIPSQLRTL